MVRVSVDPHVPDPGAIARAASVIAGGGVVAFPTDTLYGLAVDPRQAAAVDALYRIKGRDWAQPIPLIASGPDQVERCVGRLSPLARVLADRFWPGPLTLVIESQTRLAAALHSVSGRVAVRMPSHAVAVELAAVAGHPVTSTSANPSGHRAPETADEVAAVLAGSVDMLLDAGPVSGGPPSTVIDVTGPAPVLVRLGAVPWERVLESLQQP